MMKVLIVHAHPEPESFTTSMKQVAESTLRQAGHEVEISDLYEMGFNPVASAKDFQSRTNPNYLVYALEQRNGFSERTLAPDILSELDKLLSADLVIFNFPIFWFSMPALMKGWVDRVLVSGRCYGGMRFYDKGGLAGKKALVAITLGGQPHMFHSDGVHGPLEDMLRHLLRGTLGYVGFDVLKPFVGWHVPYITHDARSELLAQYRERLLHIETEPSMSFPSLMDFDETLRPVHAVSE